MLNDAEQSPNQHVIRTLAIFEAVFDIMVDIFEVQ